MAGGGLEAFTGAPLSSVRRMGAGQQLALVGAFVMVAGLVFFVSRVGSSSTMGILYSDLDPGAAAGIVDELDSRGIDYELTEGGRVVWVPQDLVATTRLDLSAAGLPDSASGWSILDNQGITSSEFDQRVGYQRAMEGELAATISVIDGVSSAKVHLVIPEQDLFVDDEISASASVLLQMDGTEALAPGQVQAVVNLVASSVEGLDASNVTVTDSSGRLLAGGDQEGVASMESDNQLRMVDSFETDLERELNALLEAVVGTGRAVVTVSADLDFDSVMTTQEEFTEPTNAEGVTLPRAETTRTEQYDNGSAGDEGVVDIETEILDGPEEGGSARTNYRLDERDVNYALNSVVTSTEKAPGTIRSLSVAVVIDEAVVDAERLPEIEALVGAAVGADAERGDLIAVNLLPFDVTVEEAQQAADEAAEAAAAAAPGGVLPLLRTIGAIVLALVVLVLGVMLLRQASRRQVIDSIDLASLADGVPELGDGDADEQLDGDGEGVLSALSAEEAERTEEDLFELIANQPDDIAAVLRQWLTQPEEVNR
ncbi:MAG: flagellar basal-body MS-ring/collar protein FliF [Acidimicrobiia bacterium]|nr:flagellar basal-body MS-ring/collar protein FliF [Acidimicrobiia bacterium]